MEHVTLVAIAGTTTLVPRHVVKSLQYALGYWAPIEGI